jgi:hypothetical protein
MYLFFFLTTYFNPQFEACTRGAYKRRGLLNRLRSLTPVHRRIIIFSFQRARGTILLFEKKNKFLLSDPTGNKYTRSREGKSTIKTR